MCNCEEKVQVKVKKLREDAIIPKFALAEDIGADIFTPEDIDILPHQSAFVKTGIALEIPKGYEGQVRPKSGIALKKGVTVLNTPGTIENTYRGELGIILFNTSDNKCTFNAGDKVAQLVIKKVPTVEIIEVEELDMNTERGTGGFGSTGK